MRVIGRKAIDLRRRDREFLFREEELIQKKSRTGAIWTGVLAATVIGAFNSIARAARR